MSKYDKAWAATIGGAVVTIAASFYPLGAEVQGAVQTLLVAFLVWAVPNRGA